MSTYAEIKNNTIVNVVECDAQFVADSGLSLTQIDQLSPIPGIGWTLTSGTWAAPAAPATTVSEQNYATLRQRAQTALTHNETFLALASPTSAQAITQVQALTRQVNALIRLDLGLLDSITDA